MGKTGSLKELLAESELFQDLDEGGLLQVAKLSAEEEYAAGSRIFAEGERAESLWVVGKGRVALKMEVSLGRTAALKQATIDVLGKGESFGWSALVEPYVFTASAFCLESCRLIHVDAARLRQLMNSDPRIGHVIMRHISKVVSARLGEVRRILACSTGVVAHDLMTPLTAVEGYLMVMLQGFAGEVSDKQKLMLERCIVRINEVVALVRNLLDASRIQSEGEEEEFTQIYLPDVLAEAVKEAQASAEEKSIKLRTEVLGNLPLISGAPGQLKQVFLKLLDNSLAFTPPGGKITISLREGEDGVVAEVADTGVGIPQGELAKVFEEYYRGRDVTFPGVGLGLSIAKKIVEAHKGKIWAESPASLGEPTRGCKVVFTLPK